MCVCIHTLSVSVYTHKCMYMYLVCMHACIVCVCMGVSQSVVSDSL